jgi:hypothetical protein
LEPAPPPAGVGLEPVALATWVLVWWLPVLVEEVGA